jgi:hypothetical protein
VEILEIREKNVLAVSVEIREILEPIVLVFKSVEIRAIREQNVLAVSVEICVIREPNCISISICGNPRNP